MGRKVKEKEVEGESRIFEIRSANIKDDFCNYSFEILRGVGAGDTHVVKGKGVIEDDMVEAFAKLNVHLACIDDVFAHSNVEIKNIDKFHTDLLTQNYQVTGFKLSGKHENECVVLIGNKQVRAVGGRINLETPKIPLDNLSSYQWYNELKDAIAVVKTEVELYKNGKCIQAVVEEEEDPAQIRLGHDLESATKEAGDVNFDDHKVD